MHRKVGGEFLHDVNAIKIAGSDIVYDRVSIILRITLISMAYYHVNKYLFQSSTIASFYG